MTDVRITQQYLEAVEREAATDLRVTQLGREAVQREAVTSVRVTQLWVEFIVSGDCPTYDPSTCPGDVVGLRTDGLPYTPTDPGACSGSGDTGTPRTGQ